MREAYCLVRDGVATVADIDLVVRDGLGLRWAAIGPFETADLNTRGGIAAHASRMGPVLCADGSRARAERPVDPGAGGGRDAQRRAELDLADWGQRVAWRDRMLMALLRARETAEP